MVRDVRGVVGWSVGVGLAGRGGLGRRVSIPLGPRRIMLGCAVGVLSRMYIQMYYVHTGDHSYSNFDDTFQTRQGQHAVIQI